MKTISIIVPAYNIENYIRRCIDSIIAQTYGAIQIIVVDDGSTDGTPQILDEYEKKDNRIRVIHQANMGLSGARNTALLYATGEYIGFVDGDDYITSDMYELMLNAIEDNDADMAICSYMRVGEGAQNDDYSGQLHILNREEALNIFVCDDRPYHIYYSVWSKLFKREIISGFNFPQGRNSEDIMFTTKALCNAGRVVFIDKPLYNYVVSRPDSLMNMNLHNRRFGDEIPFLKDEIAYIKDKGFCELSEKAKYQFCRRMLFYYIDFRKRKMKASAKKLYIMLKDDEAGIKELYKRCFIKTGDKARMELFLKLPGLYYHTVNVYDSIVIPIRNIF